MKLIVILLVFTFIFVLFLWGGNAYVEISQPFEGEEFWDYGGGVSVPFEIKVLYQLPIFSPDVDDRYYFWTNPYPFYDTTGFHRGARRHYGVDIAFNKEGSLTSTKPVVSAECGIVTKVSYNEGGFGWYVMVYYPTLNKTILYGHLLLPWVSKGQWIEPGELIGTGDATGNANRNNPHVHIEVFNGHVDLISEETKKHRINPMPTLYKGHLDSLAFNLTCRGILQNRRTWDLTGHNFWSESRQAPDTFIARFNWSSSSPLEGIHLADAKAWGKTEPTCSGFPPQQPEMEGQDQREFIIRKPRLYLYQTRGDVDVNMWNYTRQLFPEWDMPFGCGYGCTMLDGGAIARFGLCSLSNFHAPKSLVQFQIVGYHGVGEIVATPGLDVSVQWVIQAGNPSLISKLWNYDRVSGRGQFSVDYPKEANVQVLYLIASAPGVPTRYMSFMFPSFNEVGINRGEFGYAQYQVNINCPPWRYWFQPDGIHCTNILSEETAKDKLVYWVRSKWTGKFLWDEYGNPIATGPEYRWASTKGQKTKIDTMLDGTIYMDTTNIRQTFINDSTDSRFSFGGPSVNELRIDIIDTTKFPCWAITGYSYKGQIQGYIRTTFDDDCWCATHGGCGHEFPGWNPWTLQCDKYMNQSVVFSIEDNVNPIFPGNPYLFNESKLIKAINSDEETFTTATLGYIPDLEMKMNIIGQLSQPLLKEIYPEDSETTKQATPGEITLSCYPNPFNSSVNIKIYLQNKSQAHIFVKDMMGRNIENIFSGELEEGIHNFDWSCKSCPSGVYFIILNTEKQQIAKRIILSK